MLRCFCCVKSVKKVYTTAIYFEYREIFDRCSRLDELLPLIGDLDAVEAAILLCQMNADLRLTKRNRDATAKMQQELAGGLLDDEAIRRLKERFGNSNMADRPIFHPAQILDVLRLVVLHSAGKRQPLEDEKARYAVGLACLMMNDLLLTESERKALEPGKGERVARALMIQALSSFEIQNPAPMTHVAFRSRIMFHDLLAKEAILGRIRKECEGFDFEREFLRVVGLPLSTWLFVVLALYTVLRQYLAEDGSRHLEFLCVDRLTFGGESQLAVSDLDMVLDSISSDMQGLRGTLQEKRPTDWRVDFVPFRSKPLIELRSGKFFCTDLGLLAEKMHSGVYWAINDKLNREERPKLFKAWGILFEEYVNWFLTERRLNHPPFWPSPKWTDGTESFDGAFLDDSRFMPMEYKGGFLRIDARYSANESVFEADLERKIGAGCRQLAVKIQSLFNRKNLERKTLRDIPLDHVTRVVPLLIVQDSILRGPLINWSLNRKFNELLDRNQLRPDVVVEPLNVIGVHELEAMVESSEVGAFDIFRALQLRCFADPEMVSDIHNFLLTLPEYGNRVSPRIDRVLTSLFDEMEKYLFGGRVEWG